MKQWIIIGSTAAKHWFPDWREPKDLDLLTPTTVKTGDQRVLYIDAKWHRLAETLIERSSSRTFLDANLLFTLKVSHAYWNIHWDKTMYDIWQFQHRGCLLDLELHDELVKLWAEVHGAKQVNMRQGTDTFWDDAVKRRHDHEWLHQQVAFRGRPLHERVRPDPSSVWVDRALFNQLPLDLKYDLVLEELLVTAIERFNLSAASSRLDIMRAVKGAHFKLCTSMTKGWFAQFTVLSSYTLLSVQRDRWYNHLTTVLSNLPQEQP